MFVLMKNTIINIKILRKYRSLNVGLIGLSIVYGIYFSVNLFLSLRSVTILPVDLVLGGIMFILGLIVMWLIFYPLKEGIQTQGFYILDFRAKITFYVVSVVPFLLHALIAFISAFDIQNREIAVTYSLPLALAFLTYFLVVQIVVGSLKFARIDMVAPEISDVKNESQTG